jgi:hypothetical protein
MLTCTDVDFFEYVCYANTVRIRMETDNCTTLLTLPNGKCQIFKLITSAENELRHRTSGRHLLYIYWAPINIQMFITKYLLAPQHGVNKFKSVVSCHG